MASIKGIQLKAVKTFNGRQGTGFESNIYMDNKKIGHVIDYANGGCLEIDVLDPKQREEYNNRYQSYYEENPATMNDEEAFIEELFSLWEAEKTYKKNKKKGFDVLVEMRFNKRTDSLDEMFSGGGYKSPIMVSTRNEEIANREIQKENPIEHTIFGSLEDFILE